MSKITEAGYSRIPVTKSINGGTGDITGKIWGQLRSFISIYPPSHIGNGENRLSNESGRSTDFCLFGPSTLVTWAVHFDPVTVKGGGLAKHENIFSHSPINEW